MRIYTTGLKDRLSITRRALHFFAGELLSPKVLPHITINVFGLDGPVDKTNFGLVIWADDNLRPRMFDLEINTKISERNYILTLAHEMVHVRQYVRKDVVELFRPKYGKKWKGELIDIDKIRYWDQPWEIEAHALERPLANSFWQKELDKSRKLVTLAT
jgi:hypothetical protein